MAQRGDEEVPVGGDAPDPAAPQRQGQGERRLAAGRRVRDDLGQHRVELDPDHAARRHPGIPAARRRRGRAPVHQGPGGGQEAGRGVLGVQPGLDRVAVDRQALLGDRQRPALGHQKLLADQVGPGDRLGDRVLHLQPGVDLEEPEIPGGLQHELDGARAQVPHRLGGGQRGRAHPLPQAGVHGRRGALLDDLLVPPLDRALPLEAVHKPAVAVREHLDLHVPGVGDVPLKEHRAVAERGRRLTAGRGHRVRHRGGQVARGRARPR